MGKRTSPSEQFTLSYVLARTHAAPPPDHMAGSSPCMLWSGALTSGYGRLTLNRQRWLAHVAVYTMIHGAIPEGMYVHKLCRRRACTAPAHLYLGVGAREQESVTIDEMLANTARTPPPPYLIGKGDCRLWVGHTNRNGYGAKRYNGKTVKAHTVTYILLHGAVPAGLEICHLCDRPSCIAPEHLVARTRAWNSQDKVSKWRQARGERIGNAVLTADDVRAIRADPRSSRKLALVYGVSSSAICDVRNGSTWSWLD
jgi:hypothetical protein